VSSDLIAKAADARAAFDPTPPPSSLHVCHVPFEELTGAASQVETLVSRRLADYDRIALTGPIGCGKSSLARYALRDWHGRLAPIWINVATEDHERVASVRGFLEILVSQLSARAARADEIDDKRRRELAGAAQPTEQLGEIATKMGGELGGSYWLLTGKLSREVSRTIPQGEVYRATEDVRQAARDALAAIAGQERVPVLVCDDTDRLLNVAAAPDRRETLFRGFFGDVLRDIAEHLECGLVVAAHDSYRSMDGYADMTAGLLDELQVPALDQSHQIAQIITARVEFVEPDASAEDLISADAIDRLLALHGTEHERSLRKTLAVLRGALSLAAGDGSDVVKCSHIDSANA
jgi:hypothetical protein